MRITCLTTVCALFLSAHALGGPNPPRKYTSPVVTKDTTGHRVAIEVDITGARQLILEVNDGGNGTGYDWADWVEPRLVGPKGELKLTDLEWRSISGRARVDKNQGGGPLRVAGKPVAFGIGTHARSVITYDLPKGYTRFVAFGGLDNGGTDQQGSHSSVEFRVYSEASDAMSCREQTDSRRDALPKPPSCDRRDGS